MTPRHALLTAWDWEPSVVIGCAVLLTLYFGLVRPRQGSKAGLFVTGVAVLLIALVSPIDVLSDEYLFSVHMVQHLLLILIVIPLLIWAMPREFVEHGLARTSFGTIEEVLSKPALAWSVGTLTLAIWHVPLLYDLALTHEWLHIFQHLAFLVTAAIFWWPVLNPVCELRLTIGPAILYLFLASLFNSILGIAITFAPLGTYSAYLHPRDQLGILSLIRDQWRISPLGDQQLGGLLMWVPAGLIYFIFIVGAIVKWQSEPGHNPLGDPSESISRDSNVR